VFPGLPPINSNSNPTEIKEWKKNHTVTNSYKKLFKSVEVSDGSVTYMTKILNKLWPIKKNAPKVHIAYAISVSNFFLDPSNYKIQISEDVIKFKIAKYLVSF
jgi:hypothetical protein